MKLNIDCVRDIMLWVESVTTPTAFAQYVDVDMVEANSFMYLSESEKPAPDSLQLNLLENYSNEELVYHINYCLEADLLTQIQSNDAAVIIIKDLTPNGHEFIGNIRDAKSFQAVKKICKLIGVETVKSVVSISSQNTFQNIGNIMSAIEKLSNNLCI